MKLHLKRRLQAGLALICTFAMTLSLSTPYICAEDKASLENKTSDLQSQLNGINQELVAISDEIYNTEMQVTITNSEILRSEDSLALARENEAQQYENMKTRIKYMYENGNSTLLEMLFSAENMTDFLNKADFVQNISDYDRQMVDELRKTQADIENQQTSLQNQRNSLSELQSQLQARQSELETKAAATSTDLNAFQAQLQQIRKQEADEAAAKAAAEQEAAQKAAQQQAAQQNTPSGGNSTGGNSGGSISTGGTVIGGGSSVPADKGELDILAAIIQCEAYQEYNSMLAVATVILNRVNDSRFPNSVKGVVYATGQFEPVSSGRLDYVLNTGPTPLAYQVAQDALNGARVAEVADCYYFLYAGSGHSGINIGGNVFFPHW